METLTINASGLDFHKLKMKTRPSTAPTTRNTNISINQQRLENEKSKSTSPFDEDRQKDSLIESEIQLIYAKIRPIKSYTTLLTNLEKAHTMQLKRLEMRVEGYETLKSDVFIDSYRHNFNAGQYKKQLVESRNLTSELQIRFDKLMGDYATLKRSFGDLQNELRESQIVARNFQDEVFELKNEKINTLIERARLHELNSMRKEILDLKNQVFQSNSEKRGILNLNLAIQLTILEKNEVTAIDSSDPTNEVIFEDDTDTYTSN